MQHTRESTGRCTSKTQSQNRKLSSTHAQAAVLCVPGLCCSRSLSLHAQSWDILVPETKACSGPLVIGYLGPNHSSNMEDGPLHLPCCCKICKWYWLPSFTNSYFDTHPLTFMSPIHLLLLHLLLVVLLTICCYTELPFCAAEKQKRQPSGGVFSVLNRTQPWVSSNPAYGRGMLWYFSLVPACTRCGVFNLSPRGWTFVLFVFVFFLEPIQCFSPQLTISVSVEVCILQFGMEGLDPYYHIVFLCSSSLSLWSHGHRHKCRASGNNELWTRDALGYRKMQPIIEPILSL